MASARYAWGIDIGNRALKAVKLVRDGDTIRIDDYDVIEHENVLSNAGDNREGLVTSALNSFIQRHPNKKGGVVGIGVSGQASFARFIKLPPVEEKKIPEIVRFEAIQQIPFPLDEVEWSYQLFRNPESPEVEVGIFAMRKDLIAKHISYFTDVDLNVQVVQMNPLAVYNAVYHDQKLQGTTMVIDLGAENTDLIICDNDSVWMRSIPIGGNNFTETLVKAFKLSFAKAEDLKRNAATSKYARQIFQAMRPVFADLVAEIQRSVGFYASVHRESRIGKIIALGGTFKLPGLQKYLQQNLSLDVERMDAFTATPLEDTKQQAAFNENLLSMASAYGLALQALGEGKITSSLLPQSIRRAKIWKEKIPIFAAAAACFVVGTGLAAGGYLLQNLSYESANQRRDQISGVLGAGTTASNNWDKIESAGAPERATMNNVLGLLQYRDVWRHLLNDIGDAAPKPQTPVADGLLKGDAAMIKSVPRNQREQIMIDSMQSIYGADISSVLTASPQELNTLVTSAFNPNATVFTPSGGQSGAPPGGQGEGGMGGATAAPAAANPNGVRGFIVLIRGTTPHAEGHAFVRDTFCKQLEKIGPTIADPKMNFGVRRAIAVSANPIHENATRMQAMASRYQSVLAAQQKQASGTGGAGFVPGSSGGAMPGMSPGHGPEGEGEGGGGPMMSPMPGVGGAVQPGAPDDSVPYRDRLTDEDMRDDWEFTVLVAVQIDPAPPAPAAPAQPTASAQ